MKRFKQFLNVKTITKPLLETHISEKLIGTKFLVKEKKLENVNKRFPNGVSLTTSTVLTKVQPSDTFIDLGLFGNGDKEVFFELNNTVYKMTGSLNGFHSYFNEYVDKKKGISWKTGVLETAACMGVYIQDGLIEKAFSYLGNKKDIPDDLIENIISESRSILNNGEDWNKTGYDDILSGLTEISPVDFFQLTSLMYGMKKFIKEKVEFTNIKIIHDKINDYYKAEESNPKISVSGIKANTADMIITNKTAGETLEILKNAKIDFNKSSGMCYDEESGLKFYQVSLKKAVGKAQLGKITGLVKDKYGIPDNEILYNIILGESLKTWTADIVKKVSKKALTLFTKVWTNIKKWSKNLTNTLSRDLEKQHDKNIKDLFKKIGIKKINEKLLTEDFTDYIINLTDQQVDKVFKIVKEKEKKIEKILKSSNKTIILVKDPIKGGTYSNEEKLKLFANYNALVILESMLNPSKLKGDDIINDIVSLQKEMFFGKTNLPLFKVYGMTKPSDHSYEYLGVGSDFESEKKKDLSKNIILIGVKFTDQNSKYYNIFADMIDGIDDEGNPIYNTIALRTNQGSSYSFVVEGSSQDTYKQFKNKFEIT